MKRYLCVEWLHIEVNWYYIILNTCIQFLFSCASAKAEHSLSSLSCVCVYVDQNKETPTRNGIYTGNSLISSPDLDSPQKINLEWYLFFKWIPLNNSVTNLFLIVQNYLRPFQTWRHPSSPNHCKPLSQSECRHNKKSCHLLDKKGTHPMRMKITIPHATEAIRMQAFQTHTAAKPISIQLLQTQQKPHVTEALHNAEKHFLFKKRYILKTFQHNMLSKLWGCIFYSLTHEILCLVIRGVTSLINKLL